MVSTANIKRLSAVFALLTWVGLSLPAQAVMHPKYYQEAREEAAAHVQWEIIDVTAPNDSRGFGDCRVTSLVKHVFADRTNRLKPGMRLKTEISCIVDKNADIPVGGTLWTSFDALKKGMAMEVFLNPDSSHPNTWYIPNDQAVIIPHLSKTPQCADGTPGFRCPE